MGSWGVGLYAGDFASDLRSTIRAVARLPFDDERLAGIVAGTESAAASNPEDEDHTTFWLVTADQFLRRGIASSTVRDRALRIIDSGADLEMQRKLGQSASGLRQRGRMLAELRARLSAPLEQPSRRGVLRKPQAFLMDLGDVLIYPTCGGSPRNPYETRPGHLKIYGPKGGEPWSPDSWGAMVIVDRGLAFGFFAWYRPLVVRTLFTGEAPDLETLGRAPWALELAGTCPASHFRRMELQRIGAFPVASGRVREVFPGLKPGDSQAISDISIANRMKVWRTGHRPFQARDPLHRTIQIDELVG